MKLYFVGCLQLKRYTEAVLNALADPSNPITADHALILSTFNEKIQNTRFNRQRSEHIHS